MVDQAMRFYVATKLTARSNWEEVPCDDLGDAMKLYRECERAGDFDTRMYYRVAA